MCVCTVACTLVVYTVRVHVCGRVLHVHVRLSVCLCVHHSPKRDALVRLRGRWAWCCLTGSTWWFAVTSRPKPEMCSTWWWLTQTWWSTSISVSPSSTVRRHLIWDPTSQKFSGFIISVFVISQMMSISFWSMKQKSPKWHLTAGKKDRYPLFWCFFESNILLMTSPLFCEYSAPISVACFFLK